MSAQIPTAAAIEALFDSYAAAWAANDPGRIAAHWHRGEPPLYKAEEIDHFITTWEGLDAYWRHNEGFHDAVRLGFSDPAVKALADDLVLVAVRMRWDIQFAAGTRTMDGAAFPYAGTAMGGDNHVLATLRRGNDGWRFVSWSETPDAPVSYVARLYMKDVSPGFPPARADG